MEFIGKYFELQAQMIFNKNCRKFFKKEGNLSKNKMN